MDRTSAWRDERYPWIDDAGFQEHLGPYRFSPQAPSWAEVWPQVRRPARTTRGAPNVGSQQVFPLDGEAGR